MRHIQDLLSLAYLVMFPSLIVYVWRFGFQWWAFGLILFFCVGIQVIHHNHVHLGIWKSRFWNRLTDLFISIVTAVPSAMMVNGHIKNHHVHNHGPKDVTRTYRFGGDHNHLMGYLIHPFQAFAILFPMFVRQFFEEWPQQTRFAKNMAVQVTSIGAVWIALAVVDWQKFLWFVLLPQAIGLHWLLASNYFQHAHCDDDSDDDYARNFIGAINLVWFNIGYHTVHHDHPKAHWSTLPDLHRSKGQGVHPKLIQKSFVGYCFETYFLSMFIRSRRSQSLRKDEASGNTNP